MAKAYRPEITQNQAQVLMKVLGAGMENCALTEDESTYLIKFLRKITQFEELSRFLQKHHAPEPVDKTVSFDPADLTDEDKPDPKFASFDLRGLEWVKEEAEERGDIPLAYDVAKEIEIRRRDAT